MINREREIVRGGVAPVDPGPDGGDVEDHFEEMERRDPEFRDAWREFSEDPKRVFGELVLRRRIEHGLSQSKLAKIVGTSQNRIYLIENGEANPTLTTILRLAAVLGVSFEIRPAAHSTEEVEQAELVPA